MRDERTPGTSARPTLRSFSGWPRLSSRTHAVEMGVDIVSDPQREDDDGYNWTRLRYARNVIDVTPGSVVMMGSRVGTHLAKVVAWDLEVSDDDPVVTLDLLPVTPDAVQPRAGTPPHSSRLTPV